MALALFPSELDSSHDNRNPFVIDLLSVVEARLERFRSVEEVSQTVL